MNDQSTPVEEQDDNTEPVREILEHFYDVSYLTAHPLVADAAQATRLPPQTVVNHLKRELLKVIELLNPGSDHPFRAPHARGYNVLNLHYFEKMTILQVSYELGVSERQAYRDLKNAHESLGRLFLEAWPASVEKWKPATPEGTPASELDALKLQFQPVQVDSLLDHALKAIEPLAVRRDVQIERVVLADPVTVTSDPALARQVLVSLLSQTVQKSINGRLTVRLEGRPGDYSLTLASSQHRGESLVDPMIATSIKRLGWAVREEHGPDQTSSLQLRFQTPTSRLLIIDDNEGLAELVERYLTGTGCRVFGQTSAREGLAQLQQGRWDAVLLDVMMPEMDGWETLQRLRLKPETADLPVIVCSVFNDPELALSLGASGFVAKPVQKEALLQALETAGIL